MPYLDTLPEPGEEEVRTIEEDIYVIGVESLNGQTGDLTLKTINNTDLVGEGNIEVTTASDVAEAVNAEAEAREQADTQIQNTLSTKQDQLTANQLAAVNSGIDQTKVAQITTNAGDITTIESKIPDQATSENKLADKNFVNSSIATNTAYYISDNGEPFQSVADLEAYSGPLTNNDYAFVVGTDAAGNTTYTRYKYNAATNEWAEEYVLNNSSFTSDQWTAINSGATSELIAQITTNKNDIATKQDKLIAGDNIQIAADGKTISATSTTYTAGTGLTLTGTEFSVTDPVPSGFFTGSATTTGTGTSISLDGTTDASIDNVELNGDTFQQTYSGKNLFDVNSLAQGSITVTDGVATGTAGQFYTEFGFNTSGITFINPNQQITLSLTAYTDGNAGTTGNGLTIRIYYSDSTYDAAVVFSNSTTTATKKTYTSNSDKTVTSIVISYASITNNIWHLSYFQIEKGATSTDYEQYVGGSASPNPLYPQNVQKVTGEQTVRVTGKNIWNPTPYQAKHYIAADGTESTNNNIDTWGNIYVPAGTSMAVSATPGSTSATSIRVHAFTLAGVWKEQVAVLTLTGGNHGSLTFTTPNEPVLLRWCGGKALSSCQLELGSTATTYEPYQDQSYTIDLGSIELCKIDSYQDYIWKDGADWKVHKEIEKLILTGDSTEGWAYNSTTAVFVANDLVDYLRTGFVPICDYYLGQDISSYSSLQNNHIGFLTGTNSRTLIKNTSFTDANDFKNWLSSHNTTVYYVLATGTDTAITDATLIGQLEALASAQTYNPQTNIASSATGTNLPIILTVDAFKNNWAGTIAGINQELGGVEAALDEVNNGGNA